MVLRVVCHRRVLQQDVPPLPQWDTAYRQLRVGQYVVKKYRLPSPNQVSVLAAFEKEGWPYRINDPLSPQDEINTKVRLHDTIKRLNRHHKHCVIRFRGDGTGEGVCWQYVDMAARSFSIACGPKKIVDRPA